MIIKTKDGAEIRAKLESGEISQWAYDIGTYVGACEAVRPGRGDMATSDLLRANLSGG